MLRKHIALRTSRFNNMKKFYLLILSLTLTCAAFAQPRAKYVFYFIGETWTIGSLCIVVSL